jgi:hypothetical protein
MDGIDMLAWADEARRYERELRGPSQGICCNSAGPGPTQGVEEGAVLAHTFASNRYVSCPEARIARPEYRSALDRGLADRLHRRSLHTSLL